MKNTKENFNVLSLTLGLRHNDWKKTSDIMEENCLNITPFDLSKNSINSIDITKFDLIELRH